MALKEFLSARKIPYDARDVAGDESARKELVEHYGRLATPTVVMGGRVFVGFHNNRSEIEKIIAAMNTE